ncbi:AAA family ATPase [Caulobacter sp. Root1472]|uniref:AAA family ATPase n=1 Tax=Caulobacter sp. Root1472 TaxID=1736470 RepID=UPI0006FF1662|nr:AAA family ATPase [Caulobacter sp. Root1472]KQZ30961.1 ATP-dependent endonuclease [Caulobacter sp. Root1472]
MKIDFIEIGNFRKLQSVRIDLAEERTIFVGANNSGKTSAMVALRFFLMERARFSINDFTLINWHKINEWGEAWDAAYEAKQPLPASQWRELVPTLDIWLSVADTEFHYVRGILPNLDWDGGQLGVRLVLEPKEAAALQQEYVTVRAANRKVQSQAAAAKPEGAQNVEKAVQLWPECLTDFLAKRLGQLFKINAYVLDPDKCKPTEVGIAALQALADEAEPLDSNPLKGLIRVNEIGAQRGFGQADDDRDEDDDAGGPSQTGNRRLSDQLKKYYSAHLDPFELPDAKDLHALEAIETAQRAFDGRLKEGFADAIKEMETLGYPGVTDPHIEIATRVRPIDGLNHESAVQYVVAKGAAGVKALALPEYYNGLGYQNLISMVFRLMSFRDGWMKVKKAASKAAKLPQDENAETTIPPLHIVLVEEPEAHLHAQVQQVFIRQAYKILRNNAALGADRALNTQLIVSTHSSHVAHECEFSSLRYFRRLPPSSGIPTSCVVNLTTVFGEEDETKRFVTRYLRTTHADLLFADAAVLIEGPAERILVPHFIRKEKRFERLNEAYVTWLEIGGSHAHRMRTLIERLGIPTLVITDLDAGDEDGKSVSPVRGAKQSTRNTTLRKWCPEIEELDTLIDLAEPTKCKKYDAENFSVRVAYQHAMKVEFKEQAAVEALPYTFEDALVYENLDLFKNIKGAGLVAKFKGAVNDAASVAELSTKLHTILKSGGKAAFAMDMLEVEGDLALKPPRYIDGGLTWLTEQVKIRQDALLGGPPIPEVAGV